MRMRCVLRVSVSPVAQSAAYMEAAIQSVSLSFDDVEPVASHDLPHGEYL